MKWYRVDAFVDADVEDLVSLEMVSLGAAGTAIRDPNEAESFLRALPYRDDAEGESIRNYHAGHRVIGYFSTSEDMGLILGRLRDITGQNPELTIVDDSVWKDAWKEHFKPFHITRNTRILPSWSVEAASPGDQDLIMDPGMAFGTGTHETTRLCARLLEQHLRRGDAVIDVGTGTGILSLIASKAGAGRVIAVDIDTVAVKIAQENVVSNHAGNVEVSRGELSDVWIDFKADIILANLVADVILGLIPQFREHLKEGGMVICSGILRERTNEIVEAFQLFGFAVGDIPEENGWIAIQARAKVFFP